MDAGPPSDAPSPPSSDAEDVPVFQDTPSYSDASTYPEAPGVNGSTEGLPSEPVGAQVAVLSDDAGVLHASLITTDGEVHYARLDHHGWSSEVVAQNIASFDALERMDLGIALSTNGQPMIAYTRNDSDFQRVMLAERSGRTWTEQIVVDEPGKSYRFVELGLLENEPAVGFYGDEEMRLAVPSESGWDVYQVVDSTPVQGWGGISFTIGEGVAHFTYCRVSGNDTDAGVRYATFDLSSGQSSDELVRKASSSCSGSDIKLDASNAPVIAAGVDAEVTLLRPANEGWSEEMVHAHAAHEQLAYPQLAIDSTDSAHVFYGNIGTSAFHYAAPTSTGWEHYQISRETEGLHADAVVTPDDIVHVLYETRYESSGPIGYWHTLGSP